MPGENVIKVETPSLGVIEIRVTDEQVENLLTSGASALDDAARSTQWYTPVGGYGSSNVTGGIVGQNVEWGAYFPKVDDAEINALVEKALKQEKAIRDFSKAASVLLAVGVAAQMGGAVPGGFDKFKIIDVLGPYWNNLEDVAPLLKEIQEGVAKDSE